jgi:hypothetical protein
MQHPDTNASFSDMEIPAVYTMTSYSMSMLGIQFDPTERSERIVDAAFYTNMFPLNTGDLGIERQIGTSKGMERTINFSAIVQHNKYTRKLAQIIAAQLQLNKVQYDLAATTVSNVSGILNNSGIQAEINRAMATWPADYMAAEDAYANIAGATNS